MSGTNLTALPPGFDDPVHDAQVSFRAILDATANPGRIQQMPVSFAETPAPLGAAMAAVALTLCDIDTPVWLDPLLSEATAFLTFHTGAPAAQGPDMAAFAFVGDAVALPSLDSFNLGSDEHPERATTLVVDVAGLTACSGIGISGPGIRGEARLGVGGLPARFWSQRTELYELFPRGVDVLFVSGEQLAALPRSTRIVL